MLAGPMPMMPRRMGESLIFYASSWGEAARQFRVAAQVTRKVCNSSPGHWLKQRGALIAKGGIFWCRLQSEGCEVGRGEVHGNRRANESIAEVFSGLICEGHRTGANGLRGGPAGRSRVLVSGKNRGKGSICQTGLREPNQGTHKGTHKGCPYGWWGVRRRPVCFRCW